MPKRGLVGPLTRRRGSPLAMALHSALSRDHSCQGHRPHSLVLRRHLSWRPSAIAFSWILRVEPDVRRRRYLTK